MKMSKGEIAALVNKALGAAREAASAAKPVPMIVSQHANPLNDNSAVIRSWRCDEGVCGFAWVSIRPANSALANYLKAAGLGRKDSYAGGLRVSMNYGGQSLARNEAAAEAFAKVLQDAGFDRVYAQSRID